MYRTTNWQANWCDIASAEKATVVLRKMDPGMTVGIGEAGILITQSDQTTIGVIVQAASSEWGDNRIIEGHSKGLVLILYFESLFVVSLTPVAIIHKAEIFPCNSEYVASHDYLVFHDFSEIAAIRRNGEIGYHKFERATIDALISDPNSNRIIAKLTTSWGSYEEKSLDLERRSSVWK